MTPPLRDQAGQTTTEYTLVLTLTALVFAVALAAIAGPFDGLVGGIADLIVGLVPG